MKKIVCDNCGKATSGSDALKYWPCLRLNIMSRDLHFCRLACLLEYVGREYPSAVEVGRAQS